MLRVLNSDSGDQLERPIIRVLVVDDHERWRRFVAKMLKRLPDLQIVGEISDGLQAVQKAEELQPDLILLDIGLPTLNGIEAARQIRQRAQKSKILFVSQNRSPDIAEHALGTGASGYIVKSDAASELLRGVEAVLAGKQFVGRSVGGRDLADSAAVDTSSHPLRREIVAPLPPRNVAIHHEIAFYSDDAAFVDGFVRLIEAALKDGNAVIVIATESHLTGILQRLREDNVEVDAAIQLGSLIHLDAADALSTFMVNGLPDPVRCAKVVGDLINKTAKGARGQRRRVAICGECSPILLAQGNAEAAIQLEHMWNEITSTYDADTLCGYLWSSFPSQESPIFRRICA